MGATTAIPGWGYTGVLLACGPRALVTACAVIFIATAVVLPSARADSRDVTLGAYLTAGGDDIDSPAGGAGGLVAYGLSDTMALRGRLAGSYGAGGVLGLFALDALWAWDVLVWVPVFSLGPRAVINGAGKAYLGGGAGLELRRYLTFSTSVFVGVEAGWFHGGISGYTRALAGARWALR